MPRMLSLTRPGIALARVLIFALLLAVAACTSNTGAPADGDETDGDVTDGDTEDGDATDGDTSDGDTDDGDIADGDASDGDTEDGDRDTDGPEDGDLDEDSDKEEEEDYRLPPCEAEVPELRPLRAEADETFDFGPYLMNPAPTSMTVMWRSEEPGDSRLLLGTDAENLSEAARLEESVQVHRITLENLEPDTAYYYQVQTGDTRSGVHRFHTAVSPGQSFRFAVWGDNQNGPDRFREVLAGIAASTPHLLVGVGDHVQDGRLFEHWREQLFHPARALFHELAFYGAMGNHEKDSANFYELYHYPNSTTAGETRSTYSFTYGNAFFLVVDTNKLFFPIGESDTEISAWIKAQVASPEARAATWRFALAHEPGYSEAWSPGDCKYDGYPPLRNWFLPFLVEHGFHAYFSGHNHGYERASVDGLAHFVTGGGGGALDEWCTNWPQTTVVHYAHHFLNVTVGCETLRIEATYPNGEVFDWLVLRADPYGEAVEQGPVENLPSPPINSGSSETPPYR